MTILILRSHPIGIMTEVYTPPRTAAESKRLAAAFNEAARKARADKARAHRQRRADLDELTRKIEQHGDRLRAERAARPARPTDRPGLIAESWRRAAIAAGVAQ